MRLLALLAPLLVASACRAPADPDPAQAERLSNLETARARFERDPTSVDATVWYGRRLAYLGRFDDAIAIYTRGLRVHPNEPHLLRHRGHRLISTRRFEAAERDLERAAAAASDAQLRATEPDGIPNARGIPLTTLGHNVYYHLALARYLQGDYAAAARAWERGLDYGDNPDVRASAGHWMFLALCRTGPDGPAVALARLRTLDIRPDDDIVENHSYHTLCLIHLGLRDAAEVTVAAGADSPGDAALGYGLCDHLRRHGETERARELATQLVERGHPSAFGTLAAQRDLGLGIFGGG